ncbi:hypothetical protein AWENTII_002989 [Aspergillus wentii]|nr:hypothetical protein MW887_007247 [Aspergillus wentii]
MPSYIQKRTWVLSLVLRAAAFLLNAIGIVLTTLTTLTIIQLILFGVVAIWSLVEFILLCCKRTNHPVINIVFDSLSVLILVAFGIITVLGVSYVVHHSSTVNWAFAVFIIGIVCIFLAAVLHIVLLVRASLHLRDRRREGRKLAWESRQMHMGGMTSNGGYI